MKNLLVLIILFGCSLGCKPGVAGQAVSGKAAAISFERLQDQAEAALAFCKKKGYDTGNCILIDMSIHSGSNRFVVWDFAKDTALLTALVSHGCGAQPWGRDRSKDAPMFSNTDNSHCSSLGKYRIGARGTSQWGIKVNYLLHGLEHTNSNALQRQIVLHSWEDIPDEEPYPDGTPEGWGCPAVSNAVLKKVDLLLRDKSKPVLLWIYK